MLAFRKFESVRTFLLTAVVEILEKNCFDFLTRNMFTVSFEQRAPKDSPYTYDKRTSSISNHFSRKCILIFCAHFPGVSCRNSYSYPSRLSYPRTVSLKMSHPESHFQHPHHPCSTCVLVLFVARPSCSKKEILIIFFYKIFEGEVLQILHL